MISGRMRVVLVVLALGLLGAVSAGARGQATFLRVVPFEFVYPETPTTEMTPLRECVVFACQGEIEPVTFAVRSANSAHANVSITVSPLQNAEGITLPASAIESRVVKVWPQFLHDLRWTFPELLVTQDDLTDIRLTWRQQVVDGVTRYLRQSPPFPASVTTTLEQGRVKQFWLTVRIPPDQAAGIYRGTITVTASGASIGTLPLTVCVLPTGLDPPGTDTGIYLGLTLGAMAGVADPASPAKYASAVPEAGFRANLQALKDYGFEGVMFYDESYDDLKRAFAIAREIGMKGPIVQWFFPADQQKANLMAKEIGLGEFNGSHTPFYSAEDEAELRRRVALAREYGYEPWFYGIDEIPGALYPVQEEITRQIRQAGGKVITARKAGESAMRNLFDGSVYSHVLMPATEIKYTYDGQPERRKFVEPSEREYHYWGAHQERPLNNRLLAGFYHYRSGLDGIFPWGVSFIRYGEDCYHESRRNSCIFYPAQDGFVPTLQAEALREGIDDLRYIQTVRRLRGDVRELVDILQPFSYGQVRILTHKAEAFTKARLALVELLLDGLASQMPPATVDEMRKLISAEQAVTTKLHFPPGEWVTFQGGESYVPQYNFRAEDTYLVPDQAAPKGGETMLMLGVHGQAVLVRCGELHRLPRNIQIQQAELRLFHFNRSNKGTLTIAAHKITAPWKEGEATWTLREAGKPWASPGGDYDPTVLSTRSVSGADMIVKFDITQAVRDWHADPTSNFGILLRPVEGNGDIKFTSSQVADWRWKSGFYVPSFRIKYTMLPQGN